MVNYTVRKIGFLIFCAILISSYRVESAPKNLAESAVVQIRVEDAVFDKRKVPIALSQAVTRDNTSPKIRVSWSFGFAGADTQGTVLYDRKNKTIKYWLRDITEFGVLTHAILYQNVTDNKISIVGKGFEENINDFESPSGNYYLDRLIEHSCSKITLQSSFVEWHKR